MPLVLSMAALAIMTMSAGLWGGNSGTITASYGFGTQMGGETAGVDRSDDASPEGTVGNAAALTVANSSVGADGIDGNADDNDWPTIIPGFNRKYNTVPQLEIYSYRF